MKDNLCKTLGSMMKYFFCVSCLLNSYVYEIVNGIILKFFFFVYNEYILTLFNACLLNIICFSFVFIPAECAYNFTQKNLNYFPQHWPTNYIAI